VVGKDDELARFQHVAEMLYGLVDGQQLVVLCTVLLLGRVDLPGEESEGLPGVLDALLQHGTQGGRGCVCDECK
jgi:hypothetical protein